MSLFYLNVKSLATQRDGEHCVTTGPDWEMFPDQMTYFANGLFVGAGDNFLGCTVIGVRGVKKM